MATRTQDRAGLATSGLSSNDLLKKIQDSLRKSTDSLPEGGGWKTTEEWVKEWKKSNSRTFALLKHAADNGLVERFNGKVNGYKMTFWRAKV